MRIAFALALVFTIALSFAFSSESQNSSNKLLGKAGLEIDKANISAGVISGGSFQKKRQKEKPPNIVFVLSDDQDYHSLRAQKKLVSFFENGGRVFPNHFLTTPVCCPSRESFFTGRYTHNHKVYSNRVFPFKNVGKPLGGAPLAQSKKQSIALALQKSGYHTALVGKYLNGFSVKSAVPAGWSEIFATLDEDSLSPYYRYTARSKKRVFKFGDKPKDYAPRVLTKVARAAMTRAKQNKKPLFLQVSYPSPHLGSILGPAPDPDPRDVGSWSEKFSDEKCLSGAVNELDVSDKPKGIRNLPIIDNIEKFENICRARWESLLSLEREFFSLVEKSKSLGEFRDTVFIYTTDNGFFLGQHRIPKGKFLPYEESIRFPLFIKGPKIPAGRSMKMVSNIDFYPTVLGLAGARGQGYDGAHLFRGPEKKVILLEHFVKSRISPPYRALRTKRYLWARYYTAAPPWRSRPSGEEELYDLYRDPYQENNLLLSGKMISPEWISRLSKLTNCFGSSCRSLSVKPLPAPRYRALVDSSNRDPGNSSEPSQADQKIWQRD